MSWETSVQIDADLNLWVRLIGLGSNVHQFNIYLQAMCVELNKLIRTIEKRILSCKSDNGLDSD